MFDSPEQKAEKAKEDFWLVNSETHTLFNQQVFGTRSKYSRGYKRYVDPLTIYYNQTEN